MSLQLRVLTIAALIVASILGATGLQVWTDFIETRRQQETTAVDISKVVATHVVHTVIQAENMLEIIGDMIKQDGNLDRLREPAQWKRLRAYCEGVIGCRSIGVVGPTGRIVALSNVPELPDIDASDRDYFKETRESRRLYVGPAVVTRIKDNPILFPVARPVYDASGKLLAVVTIGIATDHVTDFYGLMGFAVNPTVTVFTVNGDLVARHPDMKNHVGKNNANGPLFTTYLPRAPSGVYESVSVLDGKKRIAAYRSIRDLDLVVFAGIEVSLAYKTWVKRTARTIVIVGSMLALILVVLYYGYRSVAKQSALKARNKELDKLSNFDGLTGIANRRLFDIALQRDWARYRRGETLSLSVLMIDIDCFKAYNDNYGHQAGDECLRQVAQALKSSLQRESDILARYGGEEFGAILDSDEQGALCVAERMRSAVESLGISHVRSTGIPFVTISIGLASASTCKAGNMEDLVRAADLALYEAKSQGRNRVCLHGGTNTSRELPS